MMSQNMRLLFDSPPRRAAIPSEMNSGSSQHQVLSYRPQVSGSATGNQHYNQLNTSYSYTGARSAATQHQSSTSPRAAVSSVLQNTHQMTNSTANSQENRGHQQYRTGNYQSSATTRAFQVQHYNTASTPSTAPCATKSAIQATSALPNTASTGVPQETHFRLLFADDEDNPALNEPRRYDTTKFTFGCPVAGRTLSEISAEMNESYGDKSAGERAPPPSPPPPTALPPTDFSQFLTLNPFTTSYISVVKGPYMYTPNDMLSGNQSQNEPVSLDAFNNYMNIKQQYYNSGSQSYEPPTFSTGVTTTSNMRAFPGVYTPYQQPPPLQQPRQPLQQLSPAAPCGRRMDFSFAERNVSRPQTYMRGGGSHFSKPARNEESRQKQPKEASNRSSASIPALRRVPKPPPKDPTREPLTAVHTKPLDRKQRERMGSWNWNDAVDGKGEERGGGESPRGESFSE